MTAVGQGAEGPGGQFQPGDEVIGYPVDGAYATEIVAPASSVLPKPAAISFEQASGFMLTGVTAFHAVTDETKGDTIVVHGAAGGVGLMVVQLAVHIGARVIGTAGESGHAYLRQFGAEPVVYGDGLVERIRELAPDGVDAAIDTVGTTEAIDTSLALVPDRSRIVTIAAFQRGLELGIKVLGRSGADPGTEVRSAARLDLLRFVEEDKLRVVVAAIYPFFEAADAHRTLTGPHPRQDSPGPLTQLSPAGTVSP